MDTHLNTRKVIVMDADWTEQYAIRDQIIEDTPQPTESEADAVHNYIMAAEEADRREIRRKDILYALSNEPMSLETANELLDELGKLEAGVQAALPAFGSAAWFASIEPIAWC